MASEQSILHAFAERCTTWKYDQLQLDHGRVCARRFVSHGLQTLELELDWQRRSWRLSLRAMTEFFLPTEGPDKASLDHPLMFSTTPALLSSREPTQWHYLPETDPEPVNQALVEAYEQTLAPHLAALSSPLGLVHFMQDGYQPRIFREPRASSSFDKALLLLPYVELSCQEPERELLVTKAQALGITPRSVDNNFF